MIIAKLYCTECGKKYKSHSRHKINPTLNYVGNFGDLIVTHEDIIKLKDIAPKAIETWKDEYHYGMLVLSYLKIDASSTIRTKCDSCDGSLKAFVMWVPREKR